MSGKFMQCDRGHVTYVSEAALELCDTPAECKCGKLLVRVADYKTPNQKLVDKGYRITSRKYCMASRIDRQDWDLCLMETHKGMSVTPDNQPSMEDFYRRTMSKDTITVDCIDGIPNSGHEKTMPTVVNLLHQNRELKGAIQRLDDGDITYNEFTLLGCIKRFLRQ